MKGLARNYKATVFSLFRICSSTGVLNSRITTKNAPGDKLRWHIKMQECHISVSSCVSSSEVSHCAAGSDRETERLITGLGGGEVEMSGSRRMAMSQVVSVSSGN